MMRMTSSALTTSLLISCLLLGAGCGEKSANPETVSASGIITLDGEPVEGAQIAFLPAAKGRGGFATSEADGSFTVTTFSRNDGILPGSYKVTVSKYPEVEAGGDEADIDSEEYAEPTEETAFDVEEEELQNLLPAQYETKETTPFEFEFVLGEPQSDIALNLTK